jgi:hypothetical protein
MWLSVKIIWADLMMVIGVDWVGMSDGDKLNAVSSLAVGAIGVGLGILGYRLTRRQTDIAETQEQILVATRRRKAKLRMAIVQHAWSGDRAIYDIQVFNDGDKPAEGLKWGLAYHRQVADLISLSFADDVRPTERSVPWEATELDGDRTYAGRSAMVAVESFTSEWIFPDDDKTIASFTISDGATRGDVQFSGMVIYEEGHWPSKRQLEVMSLPDERRPPQP